MKTTIRCFKCPKCGEYEVDDITFSSILTPNLRQKTHEASQDPRVLKIIAKFETSCPKCDEAGESVVKIKAFRKT